MSIAQPLQFPESSTEYRIPFWHAARVPVLFGPTRGQYWLPFSRGKLLRLLLGSYEADQTELMRKQLRPGSVLFDVGAAVGYYTVLASPLVGREGRVVSFEPDVRNAAYLRKHIAINRLTNVEVHQTAIGDRSGQAHFACGTGTGTGHLADSGAATVSICKLDDIVRRTRMPTHIKIDVEGAELQVLEGARNILTSARPTLFLSTHSPTLHEACCRYLSELGYSIQPISTSPKYDLGIVCTARQPQSNFMRRSAS